MKIILLKKTKLIFLLFVLFGFDKAKAQYPLPRPIDNPVWTYITEQSHLSPEGLSLSYYVWQLEYGSNIEINGVEYNVLIKKDQLFGLESVFAYIRQDSITQSVWIIRKYLEDVGVFDADEKLLMSLNANVGDTLSFDGASLNVGLFKLDSVTLFIGLDGVNKSKYYFTSHTWEGDPLVFIDGLGFQTPAFGPGYSDFQDTNRLLCFKLDNTEVFYDDYDIPNNNLNCNFLGSFVVSDSKFSKSEPKISLYPNPTNGILNITFDENQGETVFGSIIDKRGQKAYEFNFESENSLKRLDLSFLPKGIYMLVLNTKMYTHSSKLILTD